MAPYEPVRRELLRDAAKTLAGAAYLPTILVGPRNKRGPWAIDNVLRLAIVGAGRRGLDLMMRLGYPTESVNAPQRAIEDVELVAVCDTFQVARETACAQAGKVLTGYSDYREMLAKEDLDAVLIATPDFTHAPIARDVIEAGCDVYVEKCAANSAEQLLALEETVRERNPIVQVGYQLRQDEIYRQAREVIKKGWIGEPRMARIEVHRSGAIGKLSNPALEQTPPPQRDQIEWELFHAGQTPMREYEPDRYFEWRKYWDYSNGMCGDNLSHSVDAAEFVIGLGSPGSVIASGGTYTWDGRETPDLLTAQVEYPEQGVSVSFTQIDSNSHPVPGTVVYGTEGSMKISWGLKVFPDRFSERYKDSLDSGKLNAREPMIHIKDPAAAKAIAGKPSQMWLAGRGAMETTRGKGIFDTTRLHLENFIQSVRDRSEPAASLATTRGSTVAAILAAESYRSGRRMSPADLKLEPEQGN